MSSIPKEMMRAAGHAQKETDNTNHECLIDGCPQNAISSHSQQRGGQLKAISDNGDVYIVEKNLYTNLKMSEKGNIPRFIKRPISTASIFPGYCSTHDQMVFNAIERKPLQVNNQLQATLLFLRANSFEYLQKKRAFIWNLHFLNQVRGQLSKDSKKNYEGRMNGINQYLNIDAPYYFNAIFNSLTTNNFDNIESAWVEIPKNILISVSCCMSPLMHSHIDYMEKNYQNPQPSVSFSIVPNKNSTHLVITWLKEHSELASWFHDAIKNKNELELLINQCAFGESEDTCISPKLWESLSDIDKNEISEAVKFTRKLETPAPLPRTIKL